MTEPQAPQPRTLAARWIALIEDDTAVLQTLNKALQRAGFSVRPFASPARALFEIKAQASECSAVVTDFTLPDTDGIAVMRAVHSMAPGIPVVLISGHMGKDQVLAGYREGAYLVLQKPFAVANLVTALAEMKVRPGP